MSLRAKRIREFLKTDRAILIFSISIAFVFWLFTKLSQSYQTDMTVDVEYTLREGMICTYPPPEVIETQLEATGWDLLGRYLRGQRPKVNFELNNEETRITPLAQRAKIAQGLPDNINVLTNSIEPLVIQLDKDARKKIPLSLRSTITLANQFQLRDSILIYPDTVLIRGPESIINQINQWQTDPLVIENIDQDTEVRIAVQSHPNANISFEPEDALCVVQVEKFTEKSLVIPIEILNAPDTLLYTIFPNKTTVRFNIGLSRYDSINATHFKAVVDFNKIDPEQPGTMQIEFPVSPETLKNWYYTPQSVDFYINKNG